MVRHRSPAPLTACPALPWEPKAAFHALAKYGRVRLGGLLSGTTAASLHDHYWRQAFAGRATARLSDWFTEHL